MSPIDKFDMRGIMAPVTFFKNLPINRYRFKLVGEKGFIPPRYPSLTLRGALGWALKEAICPFLQETKRLCSTCIVRNDCPYFCLYEQKTVRPGFTEAPRGYVLYSPPRPGGRKIDLELTLFGSCNAFFPAVNEALTVCGKKGLGVGRKPFQIVSRYQVTPSGEKEFFQPVVNTEKRNNGNTLADWLNTSNNIEKIQFVTPLRLRKKGRYLGAVDWNFFYSTVARRLEGLNIHYGDGCGFGRENWQAVNKEFATWKKPSGKLSWYDVHRFSNRQQKKIPMGGLVGTLKVKDLPPAQTFWLQTASLIHAGKGAMMGLGKINLS
jgi:hypothetical protein